MAVDFDKIDEPARSASPHAQFEAEQAALAKVERAREELSHAQAEMIHAVQDLKEGEEHLKGAEAELDKARAVIRFFVDGEEYATRDPKQTPNHIIREYAHRDPATHYLVQIDKGKRISYQGKGEENYHDPRRRAFSGNFGWSDAGLGWHQSNRGRTISGRFVRPRF